MSICKNCKKNQAVVFTTKQIAGETISEGLCLPCAYKLKIGGIEQALEQAGINPDNIDSIQESLNPMIESMSGKSPFEMLKQMSDPDVFSDAFAGLNEAMDFDEDGDDGESDDDDDTDNDLITAQEGGDDQDLQPASVGSHSERRENRRNRRRKQLKYLNQYGTNLTDMAKRGEIDRMIGREKELQRVIQILNRRTKNNPALLGEPGVGKTAIAEGLAMRIAEGDVPVKLMNKQIYQLDMTTLVAGTQFRGQFENRMKGIVEDARRSGEVILLIDELHNIMGAGDAEGAMNAANILKPALSKGEISVIGSTTLDEYRRFIEKDSALERRFQKVIIEEPSQVDSVEILKGVRDYYEKHHYVHYTDDALAAAVRLSDRYIHERFLPDKAIDLIDEAGSRVNLDNKTLAEIRTVEDELDALNKENDDVIRQINNQNDEAEKLKLYEQNAELKSKIMQKDKRLTELKEECKPVEITVEDIARVVEMWTGIPVQQLTEQETEKLLNLEERLHKRVIGQNEAVDALSRAVRRKRAGFGRKNKPASFLFVGPTGVGKTELVKALAEVLFDEEDALVRLDMSEYMEAHTVSKLIGSPPGYVGYDDGGQLTEKIRRRPYSVILLDEIEKAHVDVYNILLQILDEGRLTDSHGRVVNFENTVIIMTSNAGTTLKANGIGFGSNGHIAMEARVHSVLRDLFKPEFLNRIEEIIVFHELTKEELRKIVDLMLAEVEQSMTLHGLSISVTDKARNQLAEDGYDPKYGARPLRKTIQRKIEDPLSDRYLAGEFHAADHVTADYDGEKYTFTVDSDN